MEAGRHTRRRADVEIVLGAVAGGFSSRRAAAQLAGGDPKGLVLPSTLRVETPAERWNPTEVAGRADSAVRAALPPGVTLVKLTATRGVVVPRGTTVTNVKPSVPKRAGRHTLTAVAELSAADEVVARTPLSLVIEVSEAALEPLVKKGDRLTLLVRHGNASVGASANALADANLGDAVWFKVATTGKVLKAKITSRDSGLVVDP